MEPRTKKTTIESNARTEKAVINIKAQINEVLADRILQQTSFKLRRAPHNILLKLEIVKTILLLLQLLLLISNNWGSLGYWRSFVEISTQIREGFTSTRFARLLKLDSSALFPYSLWRGWIVPSLLAIATYIVVSLLSLRHELYHWKPRLLEEYLNATKQSAIGKYLPESWLEYGFHIYDSKHKKRIRNHVQSREHPALDDAKEFVKILWTVGINLVISLGSVLVLWAFLLRTKLEHQEILRLPRSFVPPVQMLIWYLCNDFFYFYPHWIAHTKATTRAIHYKILPVPIACFVQRQLKQVHKQHHRVKANLGVAAWCCSPWEQIFFNLFPALIGPLLTQVLADAVGIEDVWGTHLVTLYVWLMAAVASSVLAHTGYRSFWNDPGKHDLHHEYAFDPVRAVNFGTMGIFDRLHGTCSAIPKADTDRWHAQRDRQAALIEASRRTGIALTLEQTEVVQQPNHSDEWIDKRAEHF